MALRPYCRRSDGRIAGEERSVSNRQPSFEPLTRGTTSTLIIGELQRRILDGSLASGQRLPSEHTLAGEFGVSRNALREAISTLVGMGTVEVRPGVGTFVAADTSAILARPLSWSIVSGSDDLLDLRQLIEVETCARAARNHSDEGVGRLRRDLDLMRIPPATPSEYLTLDMQVHRLIADMAGSRLLYHITSSILDMVTPLWRRAYEGRGFETKRGIHHSISLGQHKQIAAAIAEGDEGGAREAMAIHFDLSGAGRSI